MRAAALALALALGACVFSSEASLLDVADAATPFEDGARFEWIELGNETDNPLAVSYTMYASGVYDIAPVKGEQSPMRALFVPVSETPEEDYIAEVRIEAGAEPIYAFVWRDGDRHLILVDPGALDDAPQGAALRAAHCETLSYGQCQLASAAALRTIYLEAVYPRYVLGGARAGVLTQIPYAEPPQRAKPDK